MVKAIQVIWPQKARKQLREAYEYIKLDSVKNAELHRYRISYHIAKDEVTIVRVRHTSMDPLEY